MVPRENLEESVVRNRKGFHMLGEIPVFQRDLPYPCLTTFVNLKKIERELQTSSLLEAIYLICYYSFF